MFKHLPMVLVATAMIFTPLESVSAGTCVAGSSCPPSAIKFVPGERITVEIVNLTSSLLEVQQVPNTDIIAVSPGQIQSFVGTSSTKPNFSAMLWDTTGLSIQFRLKKPESNLLRIEVISGGYMGGDRAVYLYNDGEVEVF